MENTQVLLTLLSLRNEAMRTMRERVLRIVTTSVTLFMLFVGWIVQKKTSPELSETIFLSCIIVVFWGRQERRLCIEPRNGYSCGLIG